MIRKTLRITLFVLLLASLSIASIQAQEADNPIIFEFTEEPVVRHGERGDWDGRHTSAGAVIYHDDQFHMFRNGYQGWPLPSQFGYMVSDDGINWTEVQEEPVFTHEQIPVDVRLALLTSVLIEDDGTWVFYFTLWPENDTSRPSGIIRATADSPTGTWDIDDTLVIQPGEEGAWDAGFIGMSTVLKTEDGYVMYYSGNDDEAWAIGRATSEDGITWIKDEDPILTREQEWEEAMQDARVVQTEQGYVMLYNSGTGNYNFATSLDGITWERIQDTPIIPRSTFQRTPWLPTLAYHDGTYFAYIERDALRGTDIYAGTYTGDMIAITEAE